MAKANVRPPDIDWMQALGLVVTRAIKSVGWSSKEAVGKVIEATGAPLDDAEFGKWLSGSRRPQFDRLFAVPELQRPLLKSMARLVAGAEVVEEIRFKTAVNE
jgi:hypothetical protein